MNESTDIERTPPYGRILFVLVTASAASIMSTDLYTPSLPHLPEYFGTSPEAVKLTMTVNLVVYGLAQLVYGPLSDRFGRRPILLFAIAAFAICSLGCAAARSIEELILARALQGGTAAAEAVVVLAVIRDLFDERRRVRALAIYGMAIALAPAAAPIIGGYVHVAFGWRANFLLVTAAGVLSALLIWSSLPETATPDPRALEPRRVISAYLGLLKDSQFLHYCLILGASLGSIYAFITAGPFILIDYHGVPTEHFGYYQAAIVAAFVCGSFVSDRVARSGDLDGLMRFGLTCCAAGGVVLAALVFAGLAGPASIAGSFCLITFGLGPVFAVGPMRALECVESDVGAASALLSAFEILGGALAAAAVTILHDGTARPMGVTVLALVVIGTLAWLHAPKRARSPAPT